MFFFITIIDRLACFCNKNLAMEYMSQFHLLKITLFNLFYVFKHLYDCFIHFEIVAVNCLLSLSNLCRISSEIITILILLFVESVPLLFPSYSNSPEYIYIFWMLYSICWVAVIIVPSKPLINNPSLSTADEFFKLVIPFAT